MENLEKGENNIVLDFSSCKLEKNLVKVSCDKTYVSFYSNKVILAKENFSQVVSENSETRNYSTPIPEFIILVISMLFAIILRKRLDLNSLTTFVYAFVFFVFFETFQFHIAYNFKINEFLVPIISAVSASSLIVIRKGKFGEKINLNFGKNLTRDAILFAILYAIFIFTLKFFVGVHDIW